MSTKMITLTCETEKRITVFCDHIVSIEQPFSRGSQVLFSNGHSRRFKEDPKEIMTKIAKDDDLQIDDQLNISINDDDIDW